MRVALATRSLTRGGAQVQLVTLALRLRARGEDVSVVVLYVGGALQPTLEAGGVSVHCLNKRGRWDMLAPLFRFASIAKRERFEVIYSFLPVENLLSLMVARWRTCAVVWGLRGASQDVGQHGVASRLLWGLQRKLMGAPDAIVSNSCAALRELSLRADQRHNVVPNGIDTDRFKPDTASRQTIRSELGMQEGMTLVGCVARLDTVKDHPSLLRAAAMVASKVAGVRFAIVGGGSSDYRRSLEQLTAELGISSLVFWLGERADAERVMCALDIYVSASTAEGFSNSLAEAMACGVAPVVTDAGDSSYIVSTFGAVVPMRDPQALAQGVIEWVERDSAGARASRREWVVREFGVDRMAEQTLGVLRSVIARR